MDRFIKARSQEISEACAEANVGRALQIAQWGGKSDDAKPLKGFKGASVLEVVEDYDGDTYRTVYTVKFQRAICVLHAFQKKSKTGIKTPKGPRKNICASRVVDLTFV